MHNRGDTYQPNGYLQDNKPQEIEMQNYHHETHQQNPQHYQNEPTHSYQQDDKVKYY